MTHETIVALLLADGAGPLTIEGVLLNLGLPGVVILGLAIYARGQIKDTESRCRRLEDDNRRLYGIFTDQVIPALTKATETIGDATTIMTETRQREERQAIIEEARRRFEEARHE